MQKVCKLLCTRIVHVIIVTKRDGISLQNLHIIIMWTDISQLSFFSSVKEDEGKDIISHEDRDI